MHGLGDELAAAIAVVGAGLWAWRRWHPVSFWLLIAFPASLIGLYASWRRVAGGCGLTLRPRPPAKGLPDLVPGLGLARPTTAGWRLPVRLLDGQVPADYVEAAEKLAHAWRVHAVRVIESGPGRVVLSAYRRDPLDAVNVLSTGGELLTVGVGVLDDGRRWVIDFRVVPHWLIAGATLSGKSNLVHAIVAGLAGQPVVLLGIDLKGGVELGPIEARLSALATDRTETVLLLDEVLAELAARKAVCRTHGAREIWTLPEVVRPLPVVIVVDEVAELFLAADRAEKDQVARAGTALQRIASTGRAFGIYLVVCGQRIGSDLGPGVTALRAQLTGRVCHRVNDPETATMALGDVSKPAVVEARAIPAITPGVCVALLPEGGWRRARSTEVPDATVTAMAKRYAALARPWPLDTSGQDVPGGDSQAA
ncbi:FtsK/SpoIIIE domain-containing protein [Actinocorallia lasiicapitis]